MIDELYEKKVMDFWLSFYPEIKNKDEIFKIFRSISKKDLKKLVKERKNSQDFETEEFIQKIFSNKQTKFSEYFKTVSLNIKPLLRWIYFVSPIIEYYSKSLYDHILFSKIISKKQDMFLGIVRSISVNLVPAIRRVMIVETEIAKNEGLLIGNSPQERANYFSDVLLNDETYLRKLYLSYPELTRILDLKVKETVNYIKNIISNTEHNIINLNNVFSDNILGNLEQIELGIGDTHNGGKSVAKLIFENSVIIYKPRKLDIECGYKLLTDWLNSFDIPNTLNLRACKVYSSSDAGWMEYVQWDTNLNQEQIINFYTKIGQILCLAYTLGSTDLHYENFITAKENPVLVDLETLLGQPTSIVSKKRNVYEDATLLIYKSVKQSMLLGANIFNFKKNKSADVGALAKEQKSPFGVLMVKKLDTDNVCLVNKVGELISKSNSPRVNGKSASLKDYSKQIILGFKSLYMWILENKKLYIDKIEEIFEHCKSRILLKPTQTYWQLLQTSFHPDLLSNKLDRLVFLHRIGILYKDTMDKPYAKLFSYEIEDMLNCNIPYFSTEVNRNVLYTGVNEKIDSVFKIDILSNIKNKIQSMSEKDLEQQLFFISSSFSNTKLSKKLNFVLKAPRKNQNTDINKLKEDVFRLLYSLMELILKRSIVIKVNGKNQRVFISKSMQSDYSIYGLSVLDNSVLQGDTGIALFLSYFYKETKDEKIKIIIIEILNSILSNLDIKSDTYDNENSNTFLFLNDIYKNLGENSPVDKKFFKKNIGSESHIILKENACPSTDFIKCDKLYVTTSSYLDTLYGGLFIEDNDNKIKNFCFHNLNLLVKRIETTIHKGNWDFEYLSIKDGLSGIGLRILRFLNKEINLPDLHKSQVRNGEK